MESNLKFRFFLIAPIPPQVKGVDNVELTETFNLIKVGGLTDSMVLTGRRSDVLNVMAGLDIISACYGMNAIGRPALEAASMGKPVIVNAGYSGKSRIVLNMVTGIVIEKENPLALANSIILLAKSKELREKIGAEAFKYARENFNSNINTLRIESIYNSLLNT
jgi:glycosyltransferase involved in cell wall biosynthesis